MNAVKGYKGITCVEIKTFLKMFDVLRWYENDEEVPSKFNFFTLLFKTNFNFFILYVARIATLSIITLLISDMLKVPAVFTNNAS